MYGIAVVQMDIAIGQLDANRVSIARWLAEAAQRGARLVVFPECALSGYCFTSADEARQSAVALDDARLGALIDDCRRLDVWAIVGLLEADGPHLRNTLVVLSRGGIAGRYRKTHLPRLGVDRFVTAGDDAAVVVDVDGLRVGLGICYDCSFPESARVSALAGADLIALGTNWPTTAMSTARYIPNARALENHVYYAVASRVGHERGFDFIGHSRICEPFGETLALADHQREAILVADIDPNIARKKHLVRFQGKHEIDRMADRRPELYTRIVQPVGPTRESHNP